MSLLQTQQTLQIDYTVDFLSTIDSSATAWCQWTGAKKIPQSEQRNIWSCLAVRWTVGFFCKAPFPVELTMRSIKNHFHVKITYIAIQVYFELEGLNAEGLPSEKSQRLSIN